MKINIKELTEKIKNNKNFKIIIVCIIVLLAIIVYFIPQSENKTKSTVIDNSTEIKTDKADELESVLSNIKGCGKVSVMITYESGSESVCAGNIETQTNTTTEKTENGTKESSSVTEKTTPITVGSGSGEDALVILEKEPKVKGVIVVAQGAENLSVKLSLQSAVETVLQISANQVEIFPMN